MAATNSTTNYDLPQWVATDKPQMADFNTAMADIDTSINLVQPISGSNANGSYTKFPDGTLICWKSFTMTTASHTFTWTFPHAFNPAYNTRRLANKNIAGSIKISQTFADSGETVATNSNLIRQILSSNDNASASILCQVDALTAPREIDVMVLAIGRWK